MLKSYLKLAFRNLRKSRLYSFINIVGLSIGVAVFLTILKYIDFELSYDSFHNNSKRTYRLITTRYLNGELRDRIPLTGYGIGPALNNDLPGIENFVRTHILFGGAVISVPSRNDKHFNEEKVLFADSSFFNVFSFESEKGTLATALNGPNGIVISKKMASKYFGQQDPIGSILRITASWFSGDYAVTAVMKDMPENSHFDFQFLLPIQNLLKDPLYLEDNGWGWKNFTTYVKLSPGTRITEVERNIPTFLSRYLEEKQEVAFQPITNIHINPGFAFESSVTIGIDVIYFFAAISFFILCIAWINYVNLSTSRATERAREVGIKKVVGANKIELIIQFLFESLLLNVIAVGVGVLIATGLISVVADIVGKDLFFDFSDARLWTVLGFLILTGALLAGIYPAFILSSFSILGVLKGRIKHINRSLPFRQTLVVFQFCSSLILIGLTFLVSRQINFMRDQAGSLRMDEILVVRGPSIIDQQVREQRIATFKDQLKQIASIADVTSSVNIPGNGYSFTTKMKKTGSIEEQSGNVVYVDADFFNSYKLKFISGRDWDMDRASDEKMVILNETAMSMFRLKDGKDAIDSELVFEGDTFGIVGVVKDFHWNSLKMGNAPIVFSISKASGQFFSIRADWAQNKNLVLKIQDLYKEAFPGNPFIYFMLSDFFNNQYKDDQKFQYIFELFSTLAIVIACLGLWGLTSFSVSKKMKEIGIRKIMGASTGHIVGLLSKEFVILVLIATSLAIPCTWIFSTYWLDNFAFRIPLTWDIFVIPVLILTIICIVTVSFHIRRGAELNPTHVLRSE